MLPATSEIRRTTEVVGGRTGTTAASATTRTSLESRRAVGGAHHVPRSPARADRDTRPIRRARVTGATDGPSISLLVVDDDSAILAMVSRTLESEGYRPTTAADGAAALAAVEVDRPQLIVLDMRMPVMDGHAFARELRARGYDIPLLVMTAAPNARRAAREVDAVAYLAKPFELEDLLAAVARALSDTV